MTNNGNGDRTQPPIAKTQLAKVRKKRPDSIRQSLLAKFDTCPRSFYLYVKHDGGASAHQLDRGILFHEFVKKAVEMIRDADETMMPPEVAKAEINALITEHKELVIPEYEQNALRAMAWNWAKATVIDPDEVVGLEQKIYLELPGGTVHGTPDFATITQFGYALIDDYKTSLAIPSRDELEAGAKSFQGRKYCLLFAFGIPEGETEPWGVGIDELRYRTVYPRFTNEDTGELAYREVVYTRDQLVDYRGTLESHLEKIAHGWETGEFPAQAGSHCYECPARSECPIPEEAAEAVEEITTIEQAVELAQAWYIRDLQNRRLKSSLRAFADDYGEPIFFGDYALDFRYEERRSVIWDALDAGVPFDPGQHVKVTNSTKFDKRKVKPDERNGDG